MPISFPHVQTDGELVDVTYYTVEEAAHRLHVSRPTLREKCKRQQWPHLFLGGRYYMNAEQLARVVELLTVDPDATWADGSARTIGAVVDPDEEGVQ